MFFFDNVPAHSVVPAFLNSHQVNRKLMIFFLMKKMTTCVNACKTTEIIFFYFSNLFSDIFSEPQIKKNVWHSLRISYSQICIHICTFMRSMWAHKLKVNYLEKYNIDIFPGTYREKEKSLCIHPCLIHSFTPSLQCHICWLHRTFRMVHLQTVNKNAGSPICFLD